MFLTKITITKKKIFPPPQIWDKEWSMPKISILKETLMRKPRPNWSLKKRETALTVTSNLTCHWTWSTKTVHCSTSVSWSELTLKTCKQEMISTESENNSSHLLRANGITISLMTKIIWPRWKGILMAVKELRHKTTVNCKAFPMWTSNSSNAKTWNWPKEWTRANNCFKKLWAK